MLVSLLKVIRKVGSFKKVKVARTKGTTNKKATVAWKFAKEVSYINPRTGEKMPQKELRHSIVKKADQSPRIFNLLLVIDLGSGMHNCIKGNRGFLLIEYIWKVKKFGRWCRRRDSNPHGSPRHPLKMVCLPIPPLRHQ